MDIVRFYILSFWPTESGFGFAWQIGGTPSRILANLGLRKAYCPEEQSLYFKQLAPDEVTASLETHCCLFLFRLALFWNFWT